MSVGGRSSKRVRRRSAREWLVRAQEGGGGEVVLAVGERQDVLEVDVEVADDEADDEVDEGVAGDEAEEEVEPGELGGLQFEDEHDLELLVGVLAAEDVGEGEGEALVEEEVPPEVGRGLSDLLSRRSTRGRGRPP